MNGALMASRCQGLRPAAHRAPGAVASLMRCPLPALARRRAAPARLAAPRSRATSLPLRAASTAGGTGGEQPAEHAAAVEARLQQQKNELQSMVLSIPYKKLALWGMVFGVAYQLHEFFGVRCVGSVGGDAACMAAAAARARR